MLGTRQVNEERIGGEHLQVEDTLAARHRQVHQELHLRAHGVNDSASLLEVSEATR
jgi:hypothetical protein